MVLSINLFFIFSGCGKKGAPLPPEIKGQKITAPFDLNYKLNKSIATLFWKHEINTETAVIKPESFEVFMAKKTFEECIGCPFKFNMVGSVAVPLMKIDIKLEQGFKYYFRIQAIGENNIKSPNSKTVLIEFK